MAEIGPIAQKLKPLLLLLSSDQPGEVAAAAAAIKRTLKSSGLDFHDLVAGLTKASPKSKVEDEPVDEDDWRSMRDACLTKYRGRLRAKELEFVTSLKFWRGNLTQKQHCWLTSIYDRAAKAERNAR
jgi:hypothetical protein